jgi:hypothetical protein
MFPVGGGSLWYTAVLGKYLSNMAQPDLSAGNIKNTVLVVGT